MAPAPVSRRAGDPDPHDDARVPESIACAALEEGDLCLPCTLARLDSPLTAAAPRRRVRRREALYRQGDPFRGMYAVVAGSMKSVLPADDGNDEHVVGFHIAGDILGLDGLAAGQHESTAVALEDSEVISLPYGSGASPFASGAAVADAVGRLLSRELVRERRHLMVLNRRSAEGRVAAFLVDVSERMHARGYSPSQLRLRMTREEMGSYLQMKLETVSRAFSRLREQGLLVADGKQVHLLDLLRLRKAAALCAS